MGKEEVKRSNVCVDLGKLSWEMRNHEDGLNELNSLKLGSVKMRNFLWKASFPQMFHLFIYFKVEKVESEGWTGDLIECKKN